MSDFKEGKLVPGIPFVPVKHDPDYAKRNEHLSRLCHSFSTYEKPKVDEDTGIEMTPYQPIDRFIGCQDGCLGGERHYDYQLHVATFGRPITRRTPLSSVDSDPWLRRAEMLWDDFFDTKQGRKGGRL